MLSLPQGCFVSQLMGLLTECRSDNTPHTQIHTDLFTTTIDSSGEKGDYNFSFSLRWFYLVFLMFAARAEDQVVKVLFFYTPRQKRAHCNKWWVSRFNFNTWGTTVFISNFNTWDDAWWRLSMNVRIQNDSRSCLARHHSSRKVKVGWGGFVSPITKEH